MRRESRDERARRASHPGLAKLHDAVFNKELLCIGRAGIGVDNIPIERCTAEGIAVFNTPGANADSVKELLLCALTMASRDIVGAVEWVESLAPEGDKIPALVEKGEERLRRAGGIRQAPRRHRSRRDRLARGERRAQARYGGERVRSVSLGRFGVEPFEQGRARHGSQRSLSTCDYLTMHIHSTPGRRSTT